MVSVRSFAELQNALLEQASEIVVENTILCYHSIILPQHTTLRGADGKVVLLSFSNGDGVGVSVGNTVRDLSIQTTADQKAIYATVCEVDLGRFVFENLTLTGQFSFIARSGVLSADLSLNHITILSCDARNNPEQPQKYGVNVLQGALTIYNFNGNQQSQVKVKAENITIGCANAPVLGSGIFIAGAGDEGGTIALSRLHTGAVYSNGMLPFGIADMITAGVFILNGVVAEEVVHDGEIVTYGVNDMVLDTWGTVKNWTSNQAITSHGPSGVGFVNFGQVDNFTVNAPLQTYGLGARGYNQYDGTVGKATFQSITTYGDGSIGIQISKAIGNLTVLGDVTTHGSIGNTLVKGKNVTLPAVALSIKEGGEVQEITINGNLITYGAKVASYEVNTGVVHAFNLGGEIITKGQDSIPILIENGGQTPTAGLKVQS